MNVNISFKQNVKSSPGYDLGWYAIKSSKKPFGRQMIRSRDQPRPYPGELLNLLGMFGYILKVDIIIGLNSQIFPLYF